MNLKQIFGLSNSIKLGKVGTLDRGGVDPLEWATATGLARANIIGAYKSLSVATLAASYVNLANPGTNDLTLGTVPAHDPATGWAFDGATHSRYLKTGIVPSTNWSMIVRYSGVADGADDQALLGQSNSTGNRRFFIRVHSGATNAIGYGSGQGANRAPKLLSGVLGISGQQPYRNGTADGVALGVWDTPTNANEIYIGAQNANGVAVAFATCYIQAAAIYNVALTGPQMAEITTKMAALP